MKKNVKKGFSLAEALVAIAVIGVVAAITIPTAIDNTRNRKLAAALGRNVEAIETGCRLVVQEASELSGQIIDGIWMVNKDINGIASSDDDRLMSSASNDIHFLSQTYRFLNTAPGEGYTAGIKEINGTSGSGLIAGKQWKYAKSSKLGAYYGYHMDLEAAPGQNQSGKGFDKLNDPIIGRIYIDVNGNNTPNRFGRDIFMFGLTNSCHMVPAGTERMAFLESLISSQFAPVESEGCAGDNPTNGLSCTSRVVRNGYKMDY